MEKIEKKNFDGGESEERRENTKQSYPIATKKVRGR